MDLIAVKDQIKINQECLIKEIILVTIILVPKRATNKTIQTTLLTTSQMLMIV